MFSTWLGLELRVRVRARARVRVRVRVRLALVLHRELCEVVHLLLSPCNSPYLPISPKVTVTPHNAAVTQPEDVARAFAANLARFEQAIALPRP